MLSPADYFHSQQWTNSIQPFQKKAHDHRAEHTGVSIRSQAPRLWLQLSQHQHVQEECVKRRGLLRRSKACVNLVTFGYRGNPGAKMFPGRSKKVKPESFNIRTIHSLNMKHTCFLLCSAQPLRSVLPI